MTTISGPNSFSRQADGVVRKQMDSQGDEISDPEQESYESSCWNCRLLTKKLLAKYGSTILVQEWSATQSQRVANGGLSRSRTGQKNVKIEAPQLSFWLQDFPNNSEDSLIHVIFLQIHKTLRTFQECRLVQNYHLTTILVQYQLLQTLQLHRAQG